MTQVLDLKREHRMIGPADKEGQSWAIQDGKIFGWSESNVRFETAWWLNDDGTFREPQTPIMKNLCETRPFDPEWLK
jgi:hypothetical protein